jgi:hypothetical protein
MRHLLHPLEERVVDSFMAAREDTEVASEGSSHLAQRDSHEDGVSFVDWGVGIRVVHTPSTTCFEEDRSDEIPSPAKLRILTRGGGVAVSTKLRIAE